MSSDMGLVSAGEILRLAADRAALVGQLKAALLAGEDDAALRLARKVCGLPEEEAAE